MKLLRCALFLIAMALNISAFAQTSCSIKDKSTGSEVLSSSMLDFTFGDTFADRFEVSGMDGDKNLTIDDFNLVLMDESGSIIGFISAKEPFNGENINPDTKYRIALQNNGGALFPAISGFGINVKKRVLYIDGDDYFQATKQYDGQSDAVVDLEYANKNLKGYVKDDNIKVTFEAAFYNQRGQLDAKVGDDKVVKFSNIKIYGKNIKGYEFSLANQPGSITKNIEAAGKVYWKHDNKVVKTAVAIPYGATMGTGGNLFSDIDKLEGVTSNYNPYPEYEYIDLKDPELTPITFSASADPLMLPVGDYKIRSKFTVLPNRTAYYDDVYSNQIDLTIKESKVTVIPVDAIPEYNYGESALGVDITFKGISESGSNMPGTWKYMTEDSVWYEYGQMLPVGSYTLQAVFEPGNNNFTSKPSVFVSFEVKPRVLSVDATVPFLENTKTYDSTTAVFGINVDAANSTLCCLVDINGVTDECYIQSIDAEYAGPDVFLEDQYILAKFTLGGAQAANYVVEDMKLPAQINPLKIRTVLNGGKFDYGDANLYEGSLKPYFVYDSDPSKIVELNVESEEGSRWYMKSETVSPFTGKVPDGYYNTGVVPVHLDAVTHKIYACFQTGTQTNYEVVNNYVDSNGDLVGNDLTTIEVSPVPLKVWYGEVPLKSTKRITKLWDGNISLMPSDINVAYAAGYKYKYPEDSLVFVINGFDELSVTGDTISFYNDPSVGSGKPTRVVWSLSRGTRIAMNYYASETYQNGRITKKVQPGEPDYIFEWIKDENEYYSDNGSVVELKYGSSIGTQRPIADPRQNFDLYSDFSLLYVPESESVFSHLPVYTYREFGSASDFKPYTDGTVLPVGDYEFKAEFKSSNLDIWDNVVTDIIVKIVPIDITPYIVYEKEKYFDGTTKVKVLEYGINGLLDEHIGKVRLSPSTVESISFSDPNSGQRSINWTAEIDFDGDIQSCYRITKTVFSDPDGLIKPVEPQVVWNYNGKEVSGSVEVAYLEEFLTNLYAAVKFSDNEQAAIAAGKYSDIYYETLYGSLNADNKFLNGSYMFRATTSSADRENFKDASSDIHVSVVPETIALASDFQSGTYPYGSKIGTDFKFSVTNSAESTKFSDISISIRLNDELFPFGYTPAPGTYEVSASAFDKNGILLKGFSSKVSITIEPVNAVIVPDGGLSADPNESVKVALEKLFDGNNVAEVLSHKFTIAPISSDDAVEVEVSANYDNEKAGTDKDVYYTVSLSGNDAAKYKIPSQWQNVLYSKKGIINPLTPKVEMGNYNILYGESELGKDIVSTVTPEISGTYTFIIDGVEMKPGTLLDVKIDNSAVSSYLCQVKFEPADLNYSAVTSNYAEITVNPRIVDLLGEFKIADKYYDKTNLIDLKNQVTNPELNTDNILTADIDFVELSPDYSKTVYPYDAAGEYKGIPASFSLKGDRAFNYKLANVATNKYLTLTADSKIIGFSLNIDIPTDPEGGDPSDPQGGNNKDGEPGDDGIVTYTRIYGASCIGTDFKVDESLLNPGMSVEYQIDGNDAMGTMLVPVFNAAQESVPYEVKILVYQNSILIDETPIRIKVLKRQLKVSDLSFPHEKEWDGTTKPSSSDMGHLTNVVDGDNISISATDINFDNPEVGTGKTITAAFTVDGSACPDWLQKYIAPDDVVYKDGVITLAKILLENIQVAGSGYCSGENVDVKFAIKTSGAPSMYSLTFSQEDIDLGFRNIVKAALPSKTLDQTVTFIIPGGVSYGKHTAKIQLFDEVGSEGEIYDFNFETALNANIIHDKFNDVVLVDNSSFQYVGYEWIKDGKTVEGENNQFFNDKPCLYGWYGANVTTISGDKIKVCPVFFDHRQASKKSAVMSVNVYPNPALSMETVAIDLSDFGGQDLSTAEILVYSSLGTLSKKIENVQVKNFVNLPADNYTGVLVLGDKKLSFKLIVRD